MLRERLLESLQSVSFVGALGKFQFVEYTFLIPDFIKSETFLADVSHNLTKASLSTVNFGFKFCSSFEMEANAKKYYGMNSSSIDRAKH